MNENRKIKSGRLIKISILLLASTIATIFVAPIAANAAGPNLLSAVVESTSGRQVRLTFDDLLGSGGSPNAADFTVAGSVQGSLTVLAVVKFGSIITVDVTTLISNGQTISLTYIPTIRIPSNAANEPLAGFTTPVSHPGGSAVPQMSTDELFVNWANPSAIITSFYASQTGLTCTLTRSNFQVKVNGTIRVISSISGSNCSGMTTITLSAPLVVNDNVTLSYIPSSGSVATIFGTPAPAITDAKVAGIPDTIAPTVTLPSVSNYAFGQGGEITLVSNEPVNWQVSTDRTLSFQIFGTPQKLLVSSILPAGSYTVGLTAADDAGNTTTRSITVNILAPGATPSPTPTVTSTPKPIPSAATLYKTCTLMNKKYRGGVAQSYSSRNKGTGMYYIPRVDAALYKANFKLDKDKDGIVCER